MISLKSKIERIRTLVAEGSEPSLTYAALEARMAIEAICYDRLRIAHDYIAHDDLRKWQPAKVVQTLIAEVDTFIASDFTLSMGKHPVKPGDDLQKQEYSPIGTQVGFDPILMGKLWNALGNYPHVALPKSKSDPVRSYADTKSMKRKINEALAEFELLSTGTLVMSGFGETVSFECECGTTNKRKAGLLKDGQVVSCINPECDEKWIVQPPDEENVIWFRRKGISVNCFHCGEPHLWPEQAFLSLPRERPVKFPCTKCRAETLVGWRLCFASPPSWQRNSTDAQAKRPETD